MMWHGQARSDAQAGRVSASCRFHSTGEVVESGMSAQGTVRDGNVPMDDVRTKAYNKLFVPPLDQRLERWLREKVNDAGSFSVAESRMMALIDVLYDQVLEHLVKLDNIKKEKEKEAQEIAARSASNVSKIDVSKFIPTLVEDDEMFGTNGSDEAEIKARKEKEKKEKDRAELVPLRLNGQELAMPDGIGCLWLEQEMTYLGDKVSELDLSGGQCLACGSLHTIPCPFTSAATHLASSIQIYATSLRELNLSDTDISVWKFSRLCPELQLLVLDGSLGWDLIPKFNSEGPVSRGVVDLCIGLSLCQLQTLSMSEIGLRDVECLHLSDGIKGSGACSSLTCLRIGFNMLTGVGAGAVLAAAGCVREFCVRGCRIDGPTSASLGAAVAAHSSLSLLSMVGNPLSSSGLRGHYSLGGAVSACTVLQMLHIDLCGDDARSFSLPVSLAGVHSSLRGSCDKNTLQDRHKLVKRATSVAVRGFQHFQLQGTCSGVIQRAIEANIGELLAEPESGESQKTLNIPFAPGGLLRRIVMSLYGDGGKGLPLVKSLDVCDCNEAFAVSPNIAGPAEDVASLNVVALLEDVHKGLIRYAKGVDTLRLSSCDVVSMPVNVALVGLRRLDVSRNNISAMPSSWGWLSGLQCLDVSWNRSLRSIKGIGQLLVLNDLRCAACGLVYPSSLRDPGLTELTQLTRLKQLDLRCNMLDRLPRALGTLSSLNTLLVEGRLPLLIFPRPCLPKENLLQCVPKGDAFSMDLLGRLRAVASTKWELNGAYYGVGEMHRLLQESEDLSELTILNLGAVGIFRTTGESLFDLHSFICSLNPNLEELRQTFDTSSRLPSYLTDHGMVGSTFLDLCQLLLDEFDTLSVSRSDVQKALSDLTQEYLSNLLHRIACLTELTSLEFHVDSNCVEDNCDVFDGSLEFPSSLTELKCDGSTLPATCLNSSMEFLSDLTSLSLIKCNLAHSFDPGAICPWLTFLDVSDNPGLGYYLADAIASLSYLSNLRAHGCKLERESCVSGSQELSSLSLGRNDFRSLPQCCKLELLQDLNLDDCSELRDLDCADLPQNLCILRLKGCNVKRFRSDWSKMVNLAQLDLSFNSSLTSLSAIMVCTRLVQLKAAGCALKEVEKAVFSELKFLETLDLRDNVLDAESFVHLGSCCKMKSLKLPFFGDIESRGIISVNDKSILFPWLFSPHFVRVEIGSCFG